MEIKTTKDKPHKKQGLNKAFIDNIIKPGECRNPNGRPKGSRSKPIEIIFELFNKYQDNFKKEMETLVKRNPVAYYLKFVEPLIPKEIKHLGDAENPVKFIIEDAK